MSDITLNTQSITGNHNFVPPGTGWNLGSGSKKWNGGYFGTIIADAGIPAGTAATGGDKIGQIRFSINPNIEPGYLALNGQEVNREDYPNLWAWVQQQVGFLVEEGEWQSISEAHNGNVGKYSVGNGTSTFRLPNLGCWVRGGGTAGTATGVGGNLDAGLPNIEGTVTGNNRANFSGASGAFEPLGYTTRASLENYKNSYSGFTFDASNSNPIYGNSETVQPESIVGIWLVKAYHVPVDNMGNTITVNGVPPDENGNITIEALTNAIPVGTILPFSGNTIPKGFLACNGAGISASTYSALYAVIGNIYGGDSTTFNLPNIPNGRIISGNNLGVIGNGMTLGLTNGTTNLGLQQQAYTPNSYSVNPLQAANGSYGKTVGSDMSAASGYPKVTLGITTDAINSGVIADISNQVSVKYIIKY